MVTFTLVTLLNALRLEEQPKELITCTVDSGFDVLFLLVPKDGDGQLGSAAYKACWDVVEILRCPFPN